MPPVFFLVLFYGLNAVKNFLHKKCPALLTFFESDAITNLNYNVMVAIILSPCGISKCLVRKLRSGLNQPLSFSDRRRLPLTKVSVLRTAAIIFLEEIS